MATVEILCFVCYLQHGTLTILKYTCIVIIYIFIIDLSLIYNNT